MIKIAVLTLASTLCACATGVTFKNQSDTWVNVRVYVADPAEKSENGWPFAATGTMQIAPGKTDSYALEQNPKFKAGVQPVVHVLVEPASATWETAPSYWVECLTPLPITVVSKGARDSLQFTAENGMVSQIPQGLATGGAFVRMTVEPVQPKKDEPPPPKEAAAAPEGTGPEAPK